MVISCQDSPASLLGIFAGYCQIRLMDESGMIRTQIGMHNKSQMVTVHEMPCAIPLHNSKLHI
jgi:hypothetical protein